MDINNELFITKLDLLKNIKLTTTINILADNTFRYHIISVDIIVFIVKLISFSFTTSTNFSYENCKFNWLIIDLDKVTKSIGSII